MSSSQGEESLPTTNPHTIPVTPSTIPGSQVGTTTMAAPFTDAMAYLLSNVFSIAPSSKTYQALVYGEVFTPSQFSALNHKTISEMTYETPEMDRPLAAPQRLLLSQAVAWMHQQRVQHGKPLLPSDWLTFNANDFDDYVDALIQDDEEYDAISPLPGTTTMIPSYSPATDFQKGIKRDVSQYTSFKEDRFWDVWHRDLLAKGCTHGISEVFDPSYVPETEDARALFEVQQAFAFSIFVTHIQTASGKNIVREFTKTGDAQAIYKRLLSRYTDSPEAKSNAQELKNKLALLRLDDTWHSTCSSFLNHWRSLNLQLEDLTCLRIMLPRLRRKHNLRMLLLLILS